MERLSETHPQIIIEYDIHSITYGIKPRYKWQNKIINNDGKIRIKTYAKNSGMVFRVQSYISFFGQLIVVQAIRDC
jgi:uncharacterized membrane protein